MPVPTEREYRARLIAAADRLDMSGRLLKAIVGVTVANLVLGALVGCGLWASLDNQAEVKKIQRQISDCTGVAHPSDGGACQRRSQRQTATAIQNLVKAGQISDECVVRSGGDVTVYRRCLAEAGASVP